MVNEQGILRVWFSGKKTVADSHRGTLADSQAGRLSGVLTLVQVG